LSRGIPGQPCIRTGCGFGPIRVRSGRDRSVEPERFGQGRSRVESRARRSSAFSGTDRADSRKGGLDPAGSALRGISDLGLLPGWSLACDQPAQVRHHGRCGRAFSGRPTLDSLPIDRARLGNERRLIETFTCLEVNVARKSIAHRVRRRQETHLRTRHVPGGQLYLVTLADAQRTFDEFDEVGAVDVPEVAAIRKEAQLCMAVRSPSLRTPSRTISKS
jgi:hypothetical protein